MNYLTIEHISKSFGEKTLFDDINMTINKGDKIALIARNGYGKSTLLSILAGQSSSDGHAARIIYHNDIRVYFLEQDPQMSEDFVPRDYVLTSDYPKIRAYADYQQALAADDRAKLESLTVLMDDLNAWDVGARIDELFSRFNIDFLDRKVSQLSGGQRKRVAIARMILEEPDLIILDEPTNHLDVDAIEWLESYLSQPGHTILMVSHDRYFLENVCGIILELDLGQLWRYPGNYSLYLQQKQAKVENDESRRSKTEKLMKKELEWIRRSPKARTTKSKARIDQFHVLKEEAKKVYTDDQVEFVIQTQRLGGKIVELHNASMQFGDLQVIKPFAYKFKKNERLALVGPNGAGKSTFIKLMTEQLKPSTGKVVVGDTVTFGYYDQGGLELKADKTVIEVIRDVAEYIPLEGGKKLSAEQLLERFMFPRAQQRVYYSKLSGGERRRLYLLSVLMKNPNFLILDEPTNDLDIMTLNALEEYLMHYKGCLVLVTHDRYMTDKLVDHLFIFDGQGNIKDFNGNYTDYLSYRQQQLQADRNQSTSVPSEKTKEDKQRDFQLRKDVKRVEKQLEKLEERKQSIHDKFLDASLSTEEMIELQKELDQISQDIETKEEEWTELVERLEE